ncbi:hypothetical protein AB6A40_003020 [Gnathostoma spinigerum]|uniref:serine C-palmitoyltransferase n=1 Tax=Gnathostoma spinigerum TaxID=75299 RepID=A0ABD6E9K2_9BILA
MVRDYPQPSKSIIHICVYYHQRHSQIDILGVPLILFVMAWGQEPVEDPQVNFRHRSSAQETLLEISGDTDQNRNKIKQYDVEQQTERITRYPNEFEKTNLLTAICCYITWTILFMFAYLREFLRKHGIEKNLAAVETPRQADFVPLFNEMEAIYSRNCYKRVLDVFERPIGSVPGATVKLLDRYTDDYCWTFKYTGKQTEVINVGSYNYLGFAQNNSPCSHASASIIDEQGIALCTTIQECGCSRAQHKLEEAVANFVGAEDAICFSMGFATNSMNAPCLVDKKSLIISDQYNHASLILGCRLSGADIRVFKHNDMKDLEKLLSDAVVYGNRKTGQPYNKILLVVEGIYSMEGTICSLPDIISLKKKYKAYLYLDEAHSIGALGRTGRGVVEYWDCNPKDVDILMGTFTKSFGSAGGYIAGSKKIISHLRATTPAVIYSSPMSPPTAQQIESCMNIIRGLDGTDDGANRVKQLARNTHYFRKKLKQMGFIVIGSDDSPVVPVMIYYPTKCGLWGREMLKRHIGVVVVSFPGTEMTESRVRFCLSAGHTKEMLDEVLTACNEVGEISNAMFSTKKKLYENETIEW